MNPYPQVQRATENGESLLSLCCGIGSELSGLQTQDVTAVDLAPQYLAEVHQRCPQAKLVCMDAVQYIKEQPDNNIDVISIIDGLEHLTKKKGMSLISNAKRVARKQIVLFVPEGPAPDGYLKNQPHNAWGIEGVDHLQEHLSGWTVTELIDLGFTLVASANDTSQHGESYTALMFNYTK